MSDEVQTLLDEASRAQRASERDGPRAHSSRVAVAAHQLGDLNRRLLAAAKAGRVPASAAQQHMGRLQTYTQDLARVRRRVDEARNSAALLGGARRARRGEWSGEMHELMDEHAAIAGAHREADRVLLQASSAHSDLEAQRQRLGGVSGRLQRLARDVPGLNSLMSRIRNRRERDRLVLAGCIGSLTFLLMLYWYYM